MIQKIISSYIVQKSFPYLLGMTIANIFNYFFHLSTGRLLGPEDFGIFTSLFSLIIILSILPTTTQLVVTKYSAQYSAKLDYAANYHLLTYLSKKLFILGIIIFLILVIYLNPLANFLKIPKTPLLISFLIIPTSYFLLPINRGILQGSGLFNRLGLNLACEGSE